MKKKSVTPATEKRNKSELFRKMIEEIQGYAIILLNPNGIILNWNKGAENIHQYTEAEAVGMHFENFYSTEDRSNNLPQNLLKEAYDNQSVIAEGWQLRKDDSAFWGSVTLTALHNSEGETIGFSGVTHDLSDKKQAEDDLRNSEERYYKMIAEVEDYAIILLNEKGNIINWNTGAEKIKGYKTDEIIGRNFRIFYLPEDRANGLPENLISTATKEGKAIHEGLRVRKDGSTFWGSIVITALHAKDGRVIGFSKVTRDLTLRKEAEDKMQQYLSELEIQNRELEQFAYVASHDLQEPLRKIQTFSEIIIGNIDNREITLKYFEKINSSASRMSELIKSILNYSRLTNYQQQMDEVDLNKILEDVKNDLELIIDEKKVRIIADQLPVIRAIPSQINQLFSNLVSNSIKFGSDSPVVHITSAIIKQSDIRDRPAYLTQNKYLRISFIDNGIGFDQQYEKQLFVLFQRLHNKFKYPGTGIGLSLCKRIMENHGGFIQGCGEVGKGAEFCTYFPIG